MQSAPPREGGEEGERCQLLKRKRNLRRRLASEAWQSTCPSSCLSSQPIWWKRALKISKGDVFPSLSQMSILNQYYHFKHDRSKRNLQKLFLPQEIDTRARGKEKKIIYPSDNTMQDPNSHPAQQYCCCYHCRSARRRRLHCFGLDSKRHFCSPMKFPPLPFPNCTSPHHWYRAPTLQPKWRGMNIFQGVAGNRDSHHLLKNLLYSLSGENTPQTVGEEQLGGTIPTPMTKLWM